MNMNFLFDEDDSQDDLMRQKEQLKNLIMCTKATRTRSLKQVSHFLIDRTLGEGTFGKVKLGI